MTFDPFEIFNVPFTFSVNCRSGVVGDRCQCWRCRKGRGQPVTPASERQAAITAARCDRDRLKERSKSVTKEQANQLKCKCGVVIGLIRDGDVYVCGTCLLKQRDRLRRENKKLREQSKPTSSGYGGEV